MNAGFAEAERLTELVRKSLRQENAPGAFQAFDREQKGHWDRLLGLRGGLKTRSDTAQWVGEHAARILPCLPGSGPDLPRLAAQLKLDFA
jgi:hypothetical protein